MVDMNVIILEGLGLYIALVIVLFMIVAIAALAWSGIRQDEKIEMLNAELKQVEISNATLHRENFHYRLKFGALDVGNQGDEKEKRTSSPQSHNATAPLGTNKGSHRQCRK